MKIARDVSASHGELYSRLKAKEQAYLTLQRRFNELICDRPADAAKLCPEMVLVHAEVIELRDRLKVHGSGLAARPIGQTEMCLRLGLN
jgi:hypothetical protein